MKTYILTAVLATSLMLCACGEKKENTASVAPAESETKSATQEIIKDAARTSCDTLEWRGAKTLIKISRTPDNESDIVTGEDDIKYLDNIVTLKITSGGNVIVDKPIRKSTFRNYMDSKTYKKFVLEWIVFNKIRNGNIMLAASVANPIQEDEFLSFAITVSPNGNISISKDDNPDMSAPDNDNQQYDLD